MSAVVVQLDAETEQRLRRRATGRGETLEIYLQHLAVRDAESESPVPDRLAAGVTWLTNRTEETIEEARTRILAASAPARIPAAGTTVTEAVEGRWPGTETDEQIRDALDRMS